MHVYCMHVFYEEACLYFSTTMQLTATMTTNLRRLTLIIRNNNSDCTTTASAAGAARLRLSLACSLVRAVNLSERVKVNGLRN